MVVVKGQVGLKGLNNRSQAVNVNKLLTNRYSLPGYPG